MGLIVLHYGTVVNRLDYNYAIIKPKGFLMAKPKITHLADLQVTGALADGQDPITGRRHINLNKRERKDLSHQRTVETAVALFLDLDNDHTWQQIADELGVSLQTLRQLTKTQEFMDRYNEHFAELGHDPRLRVAQAAIVDLLPLAVRQLRAVLVDEHVNASVKLSAIKEVLKMNGIADAPPTSDRSELAKFLKEAGVNTVVQNNTINNNVPPEFAGKITAYTEGKFEPEATASEEIPNEP